MEPLIPGYFYHIYNHSIGKENLFKEEKNYIFFLQKLKKYVIPVVDIFTYCLMPNHFHILTKIKDEEEFNYLFEFSPGWKKKLQWESYSPKEENLSRYVSKQMSNLFSSYTQSYNGMYGRKGSLFIKNYKRKRIDDENYFLRLINYIHFNPVNHGFADKPSQWKYSSYNAIISNKTTMVKREQVLKWFDGLDNFKYCHLWPMEL